MYVTIAYGLRHMSTGKTLIVQTREDAHGLKSQRTAGGFYSAEMAEAVARMRAAKENVAFIGYIDRSNGNGHHHLEQ